MLEELQHLQRQINILVDHVSVLRTEIDQKDESHAKDIHLLQNELNDAKKNVQTYQERFNNNQLSLSEQKSVHQQLKEDHQALNEKYNRLENSCSELRKRFEALIQQKNQLKAESESLTTQNESLIAQIQDLMQQRDQLLKKNEVAKQKVEAIIHRLSILDTSQDVNSQEIHQLSHPSADH